MRITIHYCDICGEKTGFDHLYKLNSFHADGRGHVLAGNAAIYTELCLKCISKIKDIMENMKNGHAT